MTIEEARRILIQNTESLKANPLVIVDDCLYEAFDIAIKALEKINHLTDRPCDACEFYLSDNGCSKWNCIFESEDAE